MDGDSDRHFLVARLSGAADLCRGLRPKAVGGNTCDVADSGALKLTSIFEEGVLITGVVHKIGGGR